MEKETTSHDNRTLLASLSELSISQPNAPKSLPSDLNRSRLKKELRFRLNQLNTWRLELQSASVYFLNSLNDQISRYTALLNQKSFDNESISQLRRISQTMLCLIRPTSQSPAYEIVERQRFSELKHNLSVLGNDYSIFLDSFSSIVSDMKILSDDQTLIACSYDGTIRLWNINTGKQLKIFEGHKDYVQKIDVSQDERYLLSASKDKKVIVWDLRKWCKVYEFTSHTKPVFDVFITKDQQFVASGDEEGKVYVGYWGRFVEKLEYSVMPSIEWYVTFEYGASVRCLESNEDGKLLFVGGTAQIKVFDVENKELKSIFSGHSQIVLSIKFLDTNNHLISTGQDLKVNIWDVGKCCLFKSLKSNHLEYISSFCISRDKNFLYFVGRDANYSVLNTKHYDKFEHFKLDRGFNNAVITKNANEIIICEDNMTVVNLETKQTVFKIHSSFTNRLTYIKANHYDKYFLGYFQSGTLNFWSFDSGDIVHSSNLPLGVRNISYTPNFKYLVYISSDNKIIVQKLCFAIHS